VVNFSLTCEAARFLCGYFWYGTLNEQGKQHVHQTKAYPGTIFAHCIEFRDWQFIPASADGIEYIQKKLDINCGPVTLQEIRENKLTREQAKEKCSLSRWPRLIADLEQQNDQLASVAKALSVPKQYPDAPYRDNNAVKKYVLDGSLDLWDYAYISKNSSFLGYLVHDRGQRCLDEERFSMKCLITNSDKDVMKRIVYPGDRYFESGLYWKGILTFDDLVYLDEQPLEVQRALDKNKSLQEKIEAKAISIQEACETVLTKKETCTVQ